MGGGGRTHLLLAFVIRPLTTHPFRDGAPLGEDIRNSWTNTMCALVGGIRTYPPRHSQLVGRRFRSKLSLSAMSVWRHTEVAHVALPRSRKPGTTGNLRVPPRSQDDLEGT